MGTSWFDYLTTKANYRDSPLGYGITHLLLQHIAYTALAVFFVCLIALPLGTYLGHTHRGGGLVIGIANLGRAIPTFGIVVLFAVSSYGVSTATLTITLVLFALPPVLTNAWTGVTTVDAEITEAARGMGMRPMQVVLRTELPIASPLIMSGIRSATVQVVATATLAGYAGVGGLGVIVFDGYTNNNRAEQIAGAVLVVLLALIAQGLLGLVQRAVTPVPLRGTANRRAMQASARQAQRAPASA